MATSGQYIVIGVFDDPASADRSVMALQQAGFSQDQIRHTTGEEAEQTPHKGIKALFSGEKTAPHKNVMDDLMNMGVDPQDARIYQREYEAGHPLVSVSGTGDMQKAINVLHEQGAHAPAELARRGSDYQTSSRTGVQPGGPGVAGTGKVRDRTTGIRGSRAEGLRTDTSREQAIGEPETSESQKIRLHAERLKAYKQPEQVGEVNIHKEIVTEQQTLNVPVTREEVVVERRSLAEDATAAGEPIGQEESIRIPIREERVNVTKEPVTTGEVEISKREVRENRQFSDTVRREEARLEKEGDVPIIDSERDQPPSQPQV